MEGPTPASVCFPVPVQTRACNRTALHTLSTSLQIRVGEVFASHAQGRPRGRTAHRRRRARSSDFLPNTQWLATALARDCEARFSVRARTVQVPLRRGKAP